MKLLEKLKNFSCPCWNLVPKKWKSCDSADGSCGTKKCCPCACLVKVVVFFAAFFVLNTYFGFSNKAIEKYIAQNPRKIIESVENMVKQEREKKTEESKGMAKEKFNEITSNSAMPFVGNKNGSKVVVEFFDYNCGYCKKADSEVAKAVHQDKNVKVILVNTPILSEQSFMAAKVSVAVFSAYPDKFADFHHKLIQMKKIGMDEALNLAASLGIDKDKLKSYANSASVEEKLQNNYKIIQDIGIQGTPAFIIKGELIPGFATADDILSKA